MPPQLESSEFTRPRGRSRLLLFIATVAVILIFSRNALSYWSDLLWFDSLGYGQVFWTTLSIQVVTFAVFTAVTFLLLYGIFTLIRRFHQDDLPSSRALIIGGRPVSLRLEPVLRAIALIASLGIAILTGLTMLAEWPTLALFVHAPHATGPVTDPIFNRPLNFFLFTLPAWQMLDNWLFVLAVAACVFAIALLVLTSGTRALEDARFRPATSPWRGLSLAVSFLLLVLAVMVYVDRFSRLLEHHTIFDGVNYTDAHVMVPGLLLVSVALVLGAILAAVNASRRARSTLIGASVLPAAVCYVGLSIVSWYVGSFIVKPNELVDEQPFIAHNIELTRQAYGLDRFTRHEFPAETTTAAADPANNQQTLQNIRLWDWHALQDTLRQVQEIRTYYDFPDIDIDRYTIDGTVRQVMLSARELNVDKLPVSSRNWINEKLVYTHGYGVTMNPVNGFTTEGLPTLLLRDMPVQSTVASLKVTEPQIYFGELTNTDVYVKTRQQEFDYPQGQSNNVTSYQGTGGIALGGFLRRVLLAIDRGDLSTLPFSDDVNAGSRLLMHRNLRERITKLAPFLTFDSDPYLVVGEDGRLSWIVDAYTVADTFPYASHYGLGDNSVNYIRNSVKVVVDAYNGATTFYAFDPTDPILIAWRHLFPSLFRDASAMPPDLLRHIRYPEDLFRLQSEVYGLYHMTNPAVFFNREDLWTVATESTSDANGQQTAQQMIPNFVLMKLPGGTAEEFVEILPFTPANRNNLIGWIAGRSDAPNYGSAVVYDFPKTRLVDGPQQIEARIDQNAQLSGQLTLWNQQGSHVLRGSLLVIPTGRALLYAEPIYLQAQQSPMPELRLVVLALQDKLVYGTTFQAALTALFGGEPSSLTPSDTPPAAVTSSSKPIQAETAATGPQGLIAEAAKDLADYQRLTAEGKLGEAGQKLDQLKSVLGKLNGR